MKKVKTKFVNSIGNNDYPIYLVIKDSKEGIPFSDEDLNNYDLWCEFEIPAMAWYEVFIESIEEYIGVIEWKN